MPAKASCRIVRLRQRTFAATTPKFMKLPLLILGGRDRRGTVLPEEGQDKEPLQGYKGADLRLGGRPLVEVAIERWRGCGVFDPIYIAGPARVYDPLGLDALIVDTDGELGENLRAGAERLEADFGDGQIAVTTCDILPDPQELAAAVDDLRRHQPLDFWMPLCPVPDEGRLGASAWKPKYWVRSPEAAEAVPILPGHLMIGNPATLRLRFLYQLFDQLYRTRNRPLAYRRMVLTRSLFGSLIKEDLRHLIHFSLPYITFNVVYNVLMLVSKMASRLVTTTDFEDHLRKAFLRRKHRKLYPERRGRVVIMPCLSLAKDIDTVEEAREVSASMAQP